MNVIQTRLLDEVTRKLGALGAEYVLRLPNGTITGTAGLMATVKSAEAAPHVAACRPRFDYSACNIPEFVAGMDVGEVRVFDCTKFPHTPVPSLSCNISSRGVVTYGKGNFTVCTVGSEVQCMRLG